MVKNMKKYKGIIFDFNGTLFWDSKMHLEAWREYSKKLRSYPFTDDEMRKYMFGRTNEDIVKYLIGKQPSKELVEKCQNMGYNKCELVFFKCWRID